MCISDDIQTNSFYHGKFLKKGADNQCSSITKDSIYHINHMSILPFYHGSELIWTWTLNGSIWCILYLHILLNLYDRAAALQWCFCHSAYSFLHNHVFVLFFLYDEGNKWIGLVYPVEPKPLLVASHKNNVPSHCWY